MFHQKKCFSWILLKIMFLFLYTDASTNISLYGNERSLALYGDDLPEPCSKYSLELHKLGPDTYVCSEEGEMFCLPGWKGNRCQEPVCGPLCVVPRGVCHAPDKCFCGSGYYGDDCEHCIKRPGCVHGTCHDVGECICEEGWRGELCDEPECSQGCDPLHGYCDLPHGDCQCYPGWEGGNCSTCQPLPGCLHGTCSKPMECNCIEGWTGIFCNIEICPLTCHPLNGVCKGSQCHCLRGWQGETCEECLPYPGCIHGTCSKPWECNCSRGWGGLTCNTSKFIDDPLCPSGWTGPICTDCLKLPGCEHGACENPWECQCYEGWRGKYCSIPTCPRCHPINGFCIDADCMCRPGWKGDVCDECITYTGCQHGTCSKPWECTCKRGWTGIFCNISSGEVLVVTQPVITPTIPIKVSTISTEVLTKSSAPLTPIPTEVLSNSPTTRSTKPSTKQLTTFKTTPSTTSRTTTITNTKSSITQNEKTVPYIPPDEKISDFLDMLND